MNLPPEKRDFFGVERLQGAYSVLFGVILAFNPLQYFSIPEYVGVFLSALALGLLAYPIFVRGTLNWFTGNRQQWTFQIYTLFFLIVSIVLTLLFMLIDAL